MSNTGQTVFRALAEAVATVRPSDGRQGGARKTSPKTVNMVWRRLPGLFKEVVVVLELAAHTALAARVEREYRALIQSEELVDRAVDPHSETDLAYRAAERAQDLIATLKALDRYLGKAPSLPLKPRPTSTDDGSPFYPPAHFLRHYDIPDDLLRKAKQRGDIRTVQPKPERARFHYSEPDARRLWPHRFVPKPHPQA